MSFLGHTPDEEAQMLAEIGVASFEELLKQIPEDLRMRGPLDLPPAESETEWGRTLGAWANRNYDPLKTVSFLGAGIYDHAIPAAIDHLALRSEFYTAYTPYQAEVSQGTLAVIMEFQTMICELTGMDVANASMYDGASAAAEALLLARNATRHARVLVAAGVHPRVRAVLDTYLGETGPAIELMADRDGRLDPAALRAQLSRGEPVAALLVQQPNFYGLLEPLDELGAMLGEIEGQQPHLVVSADPLLLGLLGAPAEFGAETVVGDLQPLGTPAQFGGPTAGYFATRKAHMRRMPGRIAAETTDGEGNRGYTLTLQTREQHIRREKATSNICTNAALIALRATVYLALLGPAGLREAAEQSLRRAHYAIARLETIPGVARTYAGPCVREALLSLPRPAAEVVQRIYQEDQILAGVPLSHFVKDRPNELLVAVTEKRSREEIERLATALRRALA